MRIEKYLNLLQRNLVILGVCFFVIFVFSGFPSPYQIPKMIFAFIIVSLALVISLVRGIIKGEMRFASGKFDIGVILLTAVYFLASIIKTPNKMEAFFYPGAATFVILPAIFYLIINQFTKKGKKSVITALFVSGILLSVTVLFAKLGIFEKIPQLPEFIKDPSFNPAGGSMQSIAYLAALLPIGIAKIFKEEDSVKKVFFGVSSAVIIFGIVLVGSDLLQNKTSVPTLPPWRTSWEVMVETIKQSPFLGAGPGNYLSAFNLYRPLSYNQSDIWQLRFSSAGNYYFTLVTELGLFGLGIILVLLGSVYKKIYKDFKDKSTGFKNKEWEEIGIVILTVSLAMIPSTPSLIFLLMVFMAVFSGSEEKNVIIATNKVPAIIVSAPIFAIILGLAFFGTRAVLAEINYKLSLDALSAGKAKETYDYMNKALEFNPYVDRYHASMAQINMAIATSLAEKEDLTDIDRQTITQLVQQAISEGKATVTLNIQRSGNWEILAQIYRSIMSFAEGSDQFAIQAYSQAVALDPINPVIRVTLGGVYYALENYDSAIDSFTLAVTAKPDYANGYYNLAYAHVAKKDFDKAIFNMEKVLALVEVNSDDYRTAQTSLESLQKQRPAVLEPTTPSEILTKPPAVEDSNIVPPILLPEEATPPASP